MENIQFYQYDCLECKEDEFIVEEEGVKICRNCDSILENNLERIEFRQVRPFTQIFQICDCPGCLGGNYFANSNLHENLISEIVNLFNNFQNEEYINSLFNESSCELERNSKIKIDIESKPYSETTKTFTSCPICSDDYKHDDSVSILNCSHLFHKDCIKEWGHYNPVCPVCKASIKVQDDN